MSNFRDVGTMRIVIVVFGLSLLAGCGLTPTQKKWLGVAAGVIVVGTIAAHDDSDSNSTATNPAVGGPSVPCRPQPDGSCR